MRSGSCTAVATTCPRYEQPFSVIVTGGTGPVPRPQPGEQFAQPVGVDRPAERGRRLALDARCLDGRPAGVGGRRHDQGRVVVVDAERVDRRRDQRQVAVLDGTAQVRRRTRSRSGYGRAGAGRGTAGCGGVVDVAGGRGPRRCRSPAVTGVQLLEIMICVAPRCAQYRRGQSVREHLVVRDGQRVEDQRLPGAVHPERVAPGHVHEAARSRSSSSSPGRRAARDDAAYSANRYAVSRSGQPPRPPGPAAGPSGTASPSARCRAPAARRRAGRRSPARGSPGPAVGGSAARPGEAVGATPDSAISATSSRPAAVVVAGDVPGVAAGTRPGIAGRCPRSTGRGRPRPPRPRSGRRPWRPPAERGRRMGEGVIGVRSLRRKSSRTHLSDVLAPALDRGLGMPL